MASRSSPPKGQGQKATGEPSTAASCGKAVLPRPGPASPREAAAELEALGLILLRRSRAVLCANPDDRDFPPFDPDCTGVIELRPTADEGGGDYACPVCGRSVYPILKAKAQIDLLAVSLDRPGIERFVADSVAMPQPVKPSRRGVLVFLTGRRTTSSASWIFASTPRFLAIEWVGRPALRLYCRRLQERECVSVHWHRQPRRAGRARMRRRDVGRWGGSSGAVPHSPAISRSATPERSTTAIDRLRRIRAGPGLISQVHRRLGRGRGHGRRDPHRMRPQRRTVPELYGTHAASHYGCRGWATSRL